MPAHGVITQFILKPRYLEASVGAGRFLPESEFEWGGGAPTPLTGGKRVRRVPAAKAGKKVMWEGAARKWREHGGGAFKGHLVRTTSLVRDVGCE